MNQRLLRASNLLRKCDCHLLVAITLGTMVLTMPTLTIAQAANPLDADAPVGSTTYESPLADFRAFDPDEGMQSWVDANRRVQEIGGWRTYLRQANPPKKSAEKSAEKAPPKVELNPAIKQLPAQEQPDPKEAPDQVARVSSTPKNEDAPPLTDNVPALAEGGTDQTDEIELAVPNLPDQFSRGECPRVLTGLRLPVKPRVIELSKQNEQLLLDVAKCFGARNYIVGGHTDGRGPLRANQTLSQSRADAVRTFLVANGVDPNRITSRGYGETRPIDTNRTKRGRARNRRIDFALSR